MAFEWPDISKNQLMQVGLGLLGSGFSQGKTNPFQAASQGLAYGQQQDKLDKEEERQQAAYERQQRLEQAWAGMFGVGPSAQPDTAMQSPTGPADGLALPQPGAGPQMASNSPDMTGMGGPQMAPQGSQAGAQGNPMLAGMNPQAMPLLAALGPEKGIPYLMDAMNRKPTERRIVKGGDGRNYYADTQEPVLPNVQPAGPAPTDDQREYAAAKEEGFPGTFMEYMTQLRNAGKSETNVNVNPLTKSLSPGQEAIDKKYAEDYADFVLGGGYADAGKNLDQLSDALGTLQQEGDLTGTWSARLPDWARSYVDQEGLNTQQLIEEVVQRNLREVLGPQFTEKEGEKLIARAYDSRLSEDKNIARLERLLGAMREGLDARKSAADYFEQNETMKGYQGAQRVTIRDLEDALKEPKEEKEGPAKRMKYNAATGELEPVE